MKTKTQRGQMKDLTDPKKGLHQHKDHVQLEFMAKQTTQILHHLDDLIASTESFAPNPVKPYKLSHKDRQDLNHPPRFREIHWEEALWRGRERLTGDTVAGAWDEIVGLQELLNRRQDANGWGEVDVLAKSNNLPVVVEIKSKASERLLRATLEAVAYGIALKRAWPVLRFQWAERTGAAISKPYLACYPLVVAAPTSTYWRKVIPATDATPGRDQPAVEFWSPFYKLLQALNERGLPLQFLAIETNGHDEQCGLPNITSLKKVVFVESGLPKIL